MKRMIAVEEAIDLVLANTDNGEHVTSSLAQSLGRFLVEDIHSPIDLPSFRNSAMDGYALLFADYESGEREYSWAGEIQAGDTSTYNLEPGKAFRIFTGAPVPLNCDLVIMQENVESNGQQIVIKEEGSRKNQNIREIAEQVKKDALALRSGVQITPATIGYMASLGISKIEIRREPKIALVSTGDELVKPGMPLKFGQIYESNSAGLMTAIQKEGLSYASHHHLKDDYDSTKKAIEELLDENDFLILSGGISVGDYDFVGKALRELEVDEVFYKVKQKPGKPLFFGRKGKCHVFALPGNPAAALSCFSVYVLSSIRKFLGSSNPAPQFFPAVATSGFVKRGPRAQFLKAHMGASGVSILDGQSSNMMHTFALANCLVYLNESAGDVEIGDTVMCLGL